MKWLNKTPRENYSNKPFTNAIKIKKAHGGGKINWCWRQFVSMNRWEKQMLRQIFSAYISLKEAILERLKTSNKNKVEYGLFIPISLNLFANKAKNVWKCT